MPSDSRHRSYTPDSDNERRRHHHHRSSRHRSRSRDRHERSRHSDKERHRRDDRDEKDRDDRVRDKYSDRDTDRDRRSSKRHNDSADEDRDRSDKKDKKRRETSSERRARKAAKRARREEEVEIEEAALRAQAAELSMYSSTDNPFNDANLNQQFKWVKKQEKDRKAGLSAAEAARKDAIRRKEAQEELERLRRRRDEREAEQAAREEEKARQARLAESEHMAVWVAKEDEFRLEQARRRAQIRIRENRAKPIDLLALNLRWADPWSERDENKKDEEEDEEAGLEIDLDEPYAIFDNLTLHEMEELFEDIQMYLELEKNDKNLDFWRAMIIVAKDRLEAAWDAARGKGESEVQREISALLEPKGYEQLELLQGQVKAKLESGEPIDVEYWESLLKNILVFKAKVRLRQLHEVVLSNRLEYLRKRQRDEALKMQDELAYAIDVGAEDAAVGGMEGEDGEEIGLEAGEGGEVLGRAEEEEAEAFEREMSPEPIPASQLTYEERGLETVDTDTDRSRLLSSRRAVISSTFIPKPRPAPTGGEEALDAEEQLYRAEASKALDLEEETFNKDEEIQKQTYMWEDKFRPRKPRYFNRVHTGFEWNKYNQTHYDTDNPPPKVVQGYKFNIFYPDLIDKTKAPTYKIVKEKGNDDTVLLVFKAGPPYEDLAFRIVNREWEYSHKRGFRSSFDRGILQLYFHFKRLRYRK